jgi:hypothetical protein
MTRKDRAQSRDEIFYDLSTCCMGVILSARTCLVGVCYIVPKNHGFCGNVRRYIRLHKLLRGIIYVYGPFPENINDWEAIVPVVHQYRMGR